MEDIPEARGDTVQEVITAAEAMEGTPEVVVDLEDTAVADTEDTLQAVVDSEGTAVADTEGTLEAVVD